jgi:hypothetical protein
LIARGVEIAHDDLMSAIEQTQTSKTSGGKIAAFIGCGCGALILVALAVGALIFWGVAKAIKDNAPYNDSITAVQGNQAAIDALGSPIEPGFFPSGSININNGEGSVDFSIPVSGPNGKGTVRVVGTKPAGSGTWIYDTWQLDIEGADSIPLGQ